MADSAGQVSSKSSEKNKFSNSVSRTTSETLRLTDNEKTVTQPSSLSSSTPRKKTSFQITSVTVGSRTSNDGGDDSADDLDESHTDDISEVIDISRDIENETPSYSEDTFSKDDVFFNASASLGTAPVIPTSSQYGLAILATPDNCETILNPSDNCGNSVTGTELHVGVSDNVINLGVVSTKPDSEMRDIHTHSARHERFKVVKIESTEPFKRGRWVCMDYLDHSMSQPKPSAVSGTKTDTVGTKVNENIGNKPIDISESSPQNYSTTESIVSTGDTTQNVGTPATEESQSTSEQVSNVIPVSVPQTDNSQLSNSQQIPISSQQTYTSISPGQSLQSNIQLVTSNVATSTTQVPQQAQSLSQVPVQQSVTTSQHQSLQPQQIQQVLANANVIPVQQQQQSNIPQQPMIQQPIQQMQPVQQQPQQFTQQQQFPTMQQQQPIIQQQMPQQMQPVQQVHLSNVQQNMQGMPMQQPSGQQMQQLQQPPMQQLPQQTSQMHQVSFSQPMPQQTITQTTTQPQVQNMMQQMHPPQMQSFQQSPIMTNLMSVQTQPHLPPQYYPNMQPIQQGMTQSQAQILPPMSQGSTMPQVSMHGSNTHISLQNFPVTSLPQQMLPSMPQTPPVATSVPSYSLQFPPTSHIPTPTNQQPIVTPQIPAMATMVQPYVTMGSYASVVSSVPSTEVCVTASPDVSNAEQAPPAAALLESLAEVTANPDEVPQGEDSESLLGLARALAQVRVVVEPPAHIQPAFSASGASAVAIDNKIEQAMDLVKSHLMFAVREEVEVLKEKIAELMERITQLEQENLILKANATQETLAQLPPPSAASQQQPANPP